MFGYACNETPELMPLPIALSHRIINRLTELRQRRHDRRGSGPTPRARSRSSTTTASRPGRHRRRLDPARPGRRPTRRSARTIIEQVILPVLPAELVDGEIKYHINPTGNFVVGGPHGDAGVTGRKIIVDTYGGRAARRRRLQRQGSHEGRPLGRLHGPLRRQEHRRRRPGRPLRVQLAYAIGVSEPVTRQRRHRRHRQDPRRPDRRAGPRELPAHPRGDHQAPRPPPADLPQDRRGGHFGRTEPEFTWERTDRVKDLRQDAGI